MWRKCIIGRVEPAAQRFYKLINSYILYISITCRLLKLILQQGRFPFGILNVGKPSLQINIKCTLPTSFVKHYSSLILSVCARIIAYTLALWAIPIILLYPVPQRDLGGTWPQYQPFWSPFTALLSISHLDDPLAILGPLKIGDVFKTNALHCFRSRYTTRLWRVVCGINRITQGEQMFLQAALLFVHAFS